MKVVFRAGPRAGEEVEVDRVLSLGRLEADLELEDVAVSRRHASLQPGSDGLLVQDLGSTNGTFVNGERITGSRELRAGDRVDIGSSTFEVVGDWRAAETKALSATAPRIEQSAGAAHNAQEHKPTDRLVTGLPGRFRASEIPAPWAVAAGAALALALAVVVLLLPNGSSRDEVVAAADDLCREAREEVAELRLSLEGDGVRRTSDRLLRTRISLRTQLVELRRNDELGPRFDIFLQRFLATNDRLAAVADLSARASEQVVRSSVSRVQEAAASESRAAERVGLEECGGLPV